jgi:hypothetical protein
MARSAVFRCVFLIYAASVSAAGAGFAWPQSQEDLPAAVRNGLPGDMHKRLDTLVGAWDVEKTFYMILGTAKKPLVSKGLLCRTSVRVSSAIRTWIAATSGIPSTHSTR